MQPASDVPRHSSTIHDHHEPRASRTAWWLPAIELVARRRDEATEVLVVLRW
jgi:hypothetical protein